MISDVNMNGKRVADKNVNVNISEKGNVNATGILLVM